MRTTGLLTPGVRRCFLSVFAGLLSAFATAQVASAQEGGAGGTGVPEGASVESLFKDFLHYARLGRFNVADAYAEALLAHPDLDPAELVDVAAKDKKSVDTLLIIIKNSTIGEKATRVLELLDLGEHQKRKDSERIRSNIELLGGDPQQEHIATRHLADSGEYAVPPLVAALTDPSLAALRPRLVNALPKIGRPAVGPLVAALAIDDNNARQSIVDVLGETGYPQAIPYLRKLTSSPAMPQESKAAAVRAIQRIEEIAGRPVPGTPADLFFGLAENYYDEASSVRADPRLPEANVWYWDDSTRTVVATVVPERIFGAVMAMRCCEEALLLQSDHTPAIALWLAANTRRESRLGMNIESGDASEAGGADATRPAVFPRALYFTQAAGPRYAHLVLERAVKDNDAVVALGAIEALRITAGESSLIGTQDYKQPLVQALRFPDLVVRIRAALALGTALPKTAFADSQYVVPLLAEALTLTGSEEILVVDADADNLNRVMGDLRSGGRTVIGEATFYRGIERVRSEFANLSGVFIATDVSEPPLASAMAQLRSEFGFAKTPVVILTKPTHSAMAENIAKADANADAIDAGGDAAALEAALDRLHRQGGRTTIDADLALSLALQSTEALRGIAVDGRTVFDFGAAEPALIAALASSHEELRTKAAAVLALAGTSNAQQAIADVGLDGGSSDALRISVLNSLAESAKKAGNLLDDRRLGQLVDTARDEPDLAIRTAASEALGALNLATNKASEIIRSYYGG